MTLWCEITRYNYRYRTKIRHVMQRDAWITRLHIHSDTNNIHRIAVSSKIADHYVDGNINRQCVRQHVEVNRHTPRTRTSTRQNNDPARKKCDLHARLHFPPSGDGCSNLNSASPSPSSQQQRSKRARYENQ